MDISKYLTNKDIQLSNEDFNIEKLEKDIRKGYVPSEEVENVRKETQKENVQAGNQGEHLGYKRQKAGRIGADVHVGTATVPCRYNTRLGRMACNT